MDVDNPSSGARSNFHVGSHGLGFRRDGMEIISPFEDGILSDWEAVEALWEHVLK